MKILIWIGRAAGYALFFAILCGMIHCAMNLPDEEFCYNLPF